MALASCSDELEVAIVVPIDDDLEYVEIPISVVPAEEEISSDNASRAIIDNDNVSCDIQDLWVLQYDGISDDAILIGKQQYFTATDLTVGTDSHSPLEKIVTAKFVKSDRSCRIVVLANTLDPGLTFTKYSTLSALKERYHDSRARLSGIFSFDSAKENAGGNFPNDYDYYIEMNGYIDLVTNGATPDCIQLERNLARIDFTLKVKNDDNGKPIVTIPSDPILYDTQQYTYYFTKYEKDENYQSSVSNLFDVEPCYTEDPDTETAAGYTIYRYVYYCAPNYRGSVESVTDPKDKNTYAPKGATYIRISGQYTEDDETIPVGYTIYLGENQTTNYDLKANYRYSCTLKLDTTGDADTDSRVEKWPDVDFRKYDERSNCYILNPPTGKGQTRSFKVPIDRIDEYWGDPDYGNTPLNTLGAIYPWEAFVVWADFDYNGVASDGVTPTFELTKDTGKGCYHYEDDGETLSEYEYFEVKVAANVSGNIVIAVKAPSGTNILWSWHLWITDYDPDRAFRTGIAPIDGKYVYTVPGGQIHRYEGSDWESGGELAKSFIMDRYLGALSGKRIPQGGSWAAQDYTFPIGAGLLYQYGRKDPTYYPFFATGAKVSFCPKLYFSSGYQMKQASSASLTTSNYIHGGIFNPTIIMYNSNLSNNWFGSGSRTYWLDKDTKLKASGKHGKSIFDPSPLGWRLPYSENTSEKYAWRDFDKTTTHTFTNPDTGDAISYSNFYYKTNQGYYVSGSSLALSSLIIGKGATIYNPYLINPATETFSYLIYGSMLYWPQPIDDGINADILYPVYRYAPSESSSNDLGRVWTSGPTGCYYDIDNHKMNNNNAGSYNCFVRCVRDQ